MIGTNNALAIEAVESGRHLANHVDVKIQRIQARCRTQAPHRADAQPARLRKPPDTLRALPQPAKDVADLGIDLGHATSIVHICEHSKGRVRNDASMFAYVNAYAGAMTLAELISARAKRVMEVRGLSQERWRNDAGISKGTMSGFAAIRYDENGQMVTPSLVTVDKACAAVGIPLWAFLHTDDAMLELFLSDRAGELRRLEQEGGATASMMACMAILSEVREAARDERTRKAV